MLPNQISIMIYNLQIFVYPAGPQFSWSGTDILGLPQLLSKQIPMKSNSPQSQLFYVDRSPARLLKIVTMHLFSGLTLLSLLAIANALSLAPVKSQTCGMITLLSLLATANAQGFSNFLPKGVLVGELTPVRFIPNNTSFSTANTPTCSIGIQPQILALVLTSVRKFDQR